MNLTRSIRHRSTLLICTLILGVIVVFAAAAYHEIRGSALLSATERLRSASAEIAGILATSAEQLHSQSDSLAAHPAIQSHLRNPTAESRPAALAALSTIGNANLLVGTELWDSAGTRLLTTNDTLPTELDTLTAALTALVRDSATSIGPFTPSGRQTLYPAIARIMADGVTHGYVVRWRLLSGTVDTRDRLEDLIGGGARVHLANTAGDVWTDMLSQIEPLPIPLTGSEDATRYERADDGDAIAVAAEIGGTPWSVIVDFPIDLVLADAQRVLSWLMLIGLLLLIVGGVTAWVISGRMTGSIGELAAAASSISAGDYSRRAAVDGSDELATLSQAFNQMAENVASAHLELQMNVEQLAASQVENRETREQLERVMASSRSVIYTVRTIKGKPRLTWMSDNIERLLGYPVDHAPQSGWWVGKVHPDDRDQVRESWERTISRGESTREYRFRDADGTYRWLRDEQRLLGTLEDGDAEIIGTVSDVTDRRHLEVAKEAAEAANLAKSSFLSRMSHELRTPMNAILGFAQLLELEVTGEQNRESAQQILRGGRHLLRLIDEVLDLARVESGGMALSVEPVPLNEVIRDSFELVQGMAENRQISLDFDDTSLYVAADQQRLKQVLLNLLSNAIKYNRVAGSVRVYCEPRSPLRARISVADTGIGIAGSAMRRLFTPFDRLGADESGIEGTGLGLSLSKGLIEAMGGEIGVESVIDGGSTFWIELNIADQPEEESVESSSSRATEQFNGEVRKILYIEDNVSNLHLVQRIFSRHPNLQIIPAMQGRMGLDLARQHRPDLILLDVHLPDIMGYEVLATLQRDPELRAIPVIVISADATSEQIARLRKGGARDYVTKPFEVERLMSAVAEALENGGKS